MSREGSLTAKVHGDKLPAFSSLSDARKNLFALRDARIATLRKLADCAAGFDADGTPESLKQLEAWHGDLLRVGGFKVLKTTREEFELSMGAYFGYVVVSTCANARWHVEQGAFRKGRYEFGVKRGLMSMMLTSYSLPLAAEAGRKHDWMYREFRRYFER